jgi:peptide deformylase
VLACYTTGMTKLILGDQYKLEGEPLKVLTYPSAILKKIAEPVVEFNEEIAELSKNMLFTMYKAPGIGLAAPQVGHSKRIFCIDTDFERERVTDSNGKDTFRYSHFNPIVLINPVIKEKEGEMIYQEGCLSFPGIFEDVKRAEKVTVEYQGIDGDLKKLEAEGVQAICIQHELDHLDGIVFIERLSQLKRTFLLKKFKKKKPRKS